ncbi:MAG: hypothetical protein IJ307_05800 [Bacteroidales bacterium]|nr:hypothetical protein [Bacteroidales bacterium]
MLYVKSHNLASNLAKSEGFSAVEFLKEWQGYDLFVAVADEPSFTGYPDYVLANDNNARWANPEETESILFA